MKSQIRNIIFICMISIFILFFIGGIPFRGIENHSITENRSLVTFPSFCLSSFMDASYQDQLENALSDQLILSQNLKTAYNQFKRTSLNLTIRLLKNKEIEMLQPPASPDRAESNHPIDLSNKPAEPTPHVDPPHFHLSLTPRGDDLMELDDSHHLVFPPRTIEDADPLFTSKTNNYNEFISLYPNIDFYSYYIETDVDINFIKGEITHDLAHFLQSKFNKNIVFDFLKVSTPKDYQQYFFKTDHHWTIPGQLQGYKDIVTLLKGKEEPLLDLEAVTFPEVKYYGYKSRKLDDFGIYDSFGFWKASLPEHKEYINGKEMHYGDQSAYERGEYSLEEGTNHYGACYGYDFGLIEYDFPDTTKGNLLLFVDSFSNPINALIASHFHHTYVVDLRYYERDYGNPFDFSDFAEGKDIDKVLFSGYYFFYANDEFLIQP